MGPTRLCCSAVSNGQRPILFYFGCTLCVHAGRQQPIDWDTHGCGTALRTQTRGSGLPRLRRLGCPHKRGCSEALVQHTTQCNNKATRQRAIQHCSVTRTALHWEHGMACRVEARHRHRLRSLFGDAGASGKPMRAIPCRAADALCRLTVQQWFTHAVSCRMLTDRPVAQCTNGL